MRTETVRAKVTHQTKVKAEKILNSLGLTMSEAINLMLIQVDMQKGLPFKVEMPKKLSAETKQALDDADAGKGLKKCDDIDELFDDLGI